MGRPALNGRLEMPRPLSTSEQPRGGTNGNYPVRYQVDDGPDAGLELEHLRSENAQLRALCGELDHALQEATQQAADVTVAEERFREYDQLLEEKTETIRQLHQQLEETQATLAEETGRVPGRTGPLPREDELLS